MNTVGDYDYNEKDILGQGASGIVYKGYSKKDLKTSVAIKHVTIKNFNAKKMLSAEWIDREIQILQTLAKSPHRNIVTLLHCERRTTDIYFVMELCNGGSLDEYLQCNKTLDEGTIKIFLKQIGNGLKVAQDHDIIHRDLKPENLLLCFNGDKKYPPANDIVLKIADFGIGRFLDAGAFADTWCGTQGYMAPEILFHRKPGYDHRADLFSVGVIAYQCLVGSLPDAPIATCAVDIPKAKDPTLTEMLTGLLEDDREKRLDLKKFLNHEFISKIISVSVSGPLQQHRTILIKDNASVDDLIDKICDIFGLGTHSQAVYLVHEGRTLKRESGDSLIDSGIAHASTITFIMSVSGGHNSDLDDVRV